MRTKLVAIFCLAIFSTGIYPLRAQESRGTINGRVVDPTGAAIAGVDVRAVNQQTGVAATAKTNELGNYSIPFLVPGTYKLSADFTGFKKSERAAVEVRVGDVLSVELKLEIGAATETVEVKGGTPLMEASNVTLGR